MRNPLRLGLISLILAAAIMLPRPAMAYGIYCSSDETVVERGGMNCRQVCVYCLDTTTGEIVGLDCYDASCWFREPRPI